VGVDLESDLRAVQSIYLFVILASIFHGSVGFATSWKGVIIGVGV
jgi:hypothetical protein